MSLVNPLTGRKIQKGGKTHMKLLKMLAFIDEIEGGGCSNGPPVQYGGRSTETDQYVIDTDKKKEDYYESLLKKSKKLDTVQLAPTAGGPENVMIPKSKYQLISSGLPPNPQQHSWYHHHAPFAQNFGEYVCLKRSHLKELGVFLRDAMFADIQ